MTDLCLSLLLCLILINAIFVVCTKKLLSACLIFMAQSLIMVLIWIILQAPDLAITEAAVGSGVSSLLFFLALRRIHAIDQREEVHHE
ncbi:MAG TPA: sodium:proton antiporter [Lachnospiraceae bacterium]|nr:sodium:proton antiporter [Lachnospiraceae bacterium]